MAHYVEDFCRFPSLAYVRELVEKGVVTSMNCRMVAPLLMAGTLSLVVPGTGAAAFAEATSNAGNAAQTATSVDARQKLLDDVASLNENLVEFALDGNVAKIADTANAVGASLPKLRTAVPATAFTAIEARVRDQRTGVKTGNRTATALASVEIYRLLQEAMDPNARPVPVQVPLLDYAGFKVLALAKADPANWASIEATVKEAVAFWKQVETRIGSAALRNMLGSIMTGLNDASSVKNPAYAAFAAKMLLESVDLLEAQFMPK